MDYCILYIRRYIFKYLSMDNMAIVRKSKNGKSIQFIDEQGNMFITSTEWMRNFVKDGNDYKMMVLTRLPLRVAPWRFKKSPLYDPDGLAKVQAEKDKAAGIITTSDDSLSTKQLKDNKQMENYKDVEVW